MDIRVYLKEKKLLCDGAFGTYYTNMGGKCKIVEKANECEPELVLDIHKRYIEAGAKLIRTNTFASNQTMLECSKEEVLENVRAGYRLAVKAASGFEDVFVAGDIGPITRTDSFSDDAVRKEYFDICSALADEGADIIIFETMSSLDFISDAIRDIKRKKDIFVIVQFCVNQYGYSNAGRSAVNLLNEAAAMKEVDAVGFNCGVGPVHLYNLMKKIEFPKDKYITALPNAGYPKLMQNRIVFMNNEEYFADRECEIAELGVDILGGCCGTTPEYIKRLQSGLEHIRNRYCTDVEVQEIRSNDIKVDRSFFANMSDGKKLIAVELAPPIGANDEKIMDAANMLKDSGVDVVTFPDSPSGRTRADSILMAVKIHEATGMNVMPHICCRDKNAIAMRSSILGAYMNNIYNFLILTGDPVPTMIRQNVKSVFNFDSVNLMKIVNDMNDEHFSNMPVTFGGVINYDRLNLDVEIRRVKSKMNAGAKFFFTQPLFTSEDVLKVKKIKNETNAMILCGIMPLVSRKNAVFIKNEMAGIRVTDSIVERFSDNMSREESEAEGVKIAAEIIDEVSCFADGYYFTFPFNRVYLLDKILKKS